MSRTFRSGSDRESDPRSIVARGLRLAMRLPTGVSDRPVFGRGQPRPPATGDRSSPWHGPANVGRAVPQRPRLGSSWRSRRSPRTPEASRQSRQAGPVRLRPVLASDCSPPPGADARTWTVPGSDRWDCCRRLVWSLLSHPRVQARLGCADCSPHPVRPADRHEGAHNAAVSGCWATCSVVRRRGPKVPSVPPRERRSLIADTVSEIGR